MITTRNNRFSLPLFWVVTLHPVGKIHIKNDLPSWKPDPFFQWFAQVFLTSVLSSLVLLCHITTYHLHQPVRLFPSPLLPTDLSLRHHPHRIHMRKQALIWTRPLTFSKGNPFNQIILKAKQPLQGFPLAAWKSKSAENAEKPHRCSGIYILMQMEMEIHYIKKNPQTIQSLPNFHIDKIPHICFLKGWQKIEN